MKKLVQILWLTLSVAALLTAQDGNKLIEKLDKKYVAIFPFHFASTNLSERNAMNELNGLFSDLFAGQFAATDYFEVLDRQNMDALLKEVSIQASGLTSEQVVEMGKTKGAELAIFGTVTNVYKNTYLTLKIIDIETSIILKSIKVKGSLAEIDAFAEEGGFEFMKGLSLLLYERYQIGDGQIESASREGIRQFMKARDLIAQAIVAKQEGNKSKMKKLKSKAENYLEKAAAVNPGVQAAIQLYRENTLWKLEE
ncbi:MAG: hypothetical protein JXQ65_06840 [Candidatus Marinimicrobia bacterium]|nr:hypothetical protein [Candidatus Neomarinimicrobiota bacterium]